MFFVLLEPFGFRNMGRIKNDFPIFCPITPGGRLAERWKKVAEEVRTSSNNKIRPKVIEQTGLPLVRVVRVRKCPADEAVWGEWCTTSSA